MDLWFGDRRVSNSQIVAVPVVVDPNAALELDGLEQQFRFMEPELLGWFRRRVLDPTEAEDLVQDTFLRATQSSGRSDVKQISAYLYAVARSVIADRQRRRLVRHADGHVPLTDVDPEAEQADVLRAMLARERLDRVTSSLRLLPERTRAIFILRRLEGLRYAEIAARLGISISAVEKQMARAISHLNSSLGEGA